MDSNDELDDAKTVSGRTLESNLGERTTKAQTCAKVCFALCTMPIKSHRARSAL